MADFAEIVLHQRSIETFAAAGLLGPGRAVEHAHSLAPVRVKLPPLEAGSFFLKRWQVRELPDQGVWRHPAYHSYAPPIFVARDALVHSSAGIVAVNDQVVAETLANTKAETHGFRTLAKGIAIHPPQVRQLAGVYISLLAGGEANYYNSVLNSLARLACVPENYQAACAGLLVPRGALRQRELLALLDLMPSLAVIEVGRDETLQVETLILPLSVTGDSVFHPCVLDFFREISTNVPPLARPVPRRIYIDCSGHKLRNEPDLVAALTCMDFVVIRPENMSVADQVRLFRGAEIIVAPHGAALTNLGFCRPGTRVVELLMDAYCNWCFRNLAGLNQLRYDCVLGRARLPWPDFGPALHDTPWDISVTHVVAAVAHTAEQVAA